jgi:hypothetical protein
MIACIDTQDSYRFNIRFHLPYKDPRRLKVQPWSVLQRFASEEITTMVIACKFPPVQGISWFHHQCDQHQQ